MGATHNRVIKMIRLLDVRSKEDAFDTKFGEKGIRIGFRPKKRRASLLGYAAIQYGVEDETDPLQMGAAYAYVSVNFSPFVHDVHNLQGAGRDLA